jgi:hypothetical protein
MNKVTMEVAPTPPDSSLISGVMNALENSYMQVYARLCMQGEITPEITSDYLEFCEVAREMFKTLRGSFSLPTVYSMLPDNTWVQLYQECVSPMGFEHAPTTIH